MYPFFLSLQVPPKTGITTENVNKHLPSKPSIGLGFNLSHFGVEQDPSIPTTADQGGLPWTACNED